MTSVGTLSSRSQCMHTSSFLLHPNRTLATRSTVHLSSRNSLTILGKQFGRACGCARAKKESALEAASDPIPASAIATTIALWLCSELPVLAEEGVDFSKGGFAKESYYVTLGLFLLSLPGLWSLIKRAPKAKYVRKTYEVEGPAAPQGQKLEDWAKRIFLYFKKYNYEVKERGETITFVGNYQASKGQAAALTFYTFVGLGCTALVLSIAVPAVGNYWYGLTTISPLAGYYYLQRGERQEQVKVKLVTDDEEKTTDIVMEGDQEELERFVKELGVREKGKIYVKGILEGSS